MGTDVYMKWKTQNKKDKKKQVTGFSITAGDKGYLRASISMYRENSLLRDIFPEEYWKSDGYTAYDFEKNFSRCMHLLKGYMLCEIMGVSFDDKRETHKEQQDMGNKVTELFKKLGAEVLNESNGLGFDSVLAWANSLMNFFELGMKKQKEGLKPEIYISW